MGTLYRVSKTFGQRPSSIIGVRGKWEAYQFDVSVMMTGLEMELEANEPEQGGKDNKPAARGSWGSLLGGG